MLNMQLHTRTWCIMLAYIAACVMATEVYAMGNSFLLQNFCNTGAGVVERVVNCIEQEVLNVGRQFIGIIYTPLSNTITVVLILGVIFYGVALLMGMVEKVARDTFVVVLKIAFILFITQNMLWVLNAAIGAFRDLMTLVVQWSTITLTIGGTMRCPPAIFGTVWSRIDCLLGTLIGFQGTNGIDMSDSLVAFFFYHFMSGATGIIIGIIGLWLIFAFVMGLLKATATYILAFMALVMMMVVGILFVPLLMFKVTYDMFKRWARICIAMILQPLILFAFLNVVLAAFDAMLFASNDSVMRTFAGPGFSRTDNLTDYLQDNNLLMEEYKAACLEMNATEQSTVSQLDLGTNVAQGGLVSHLGQYTGGRNLYDCQEGVQEDIPLRIDLMRIDYENGAAVPGAAGEAASLDAMLGAMIAAGLVGFILVALLDYIPKMAEDLSGGVAEAAGVARAASEDLPMGMSGAGAMASNMGGKMAGLVTRAK